VVVNGVMADQDARPVRARPFRSASAAGSASSNGTVRLPRALRGQLSSGHHIVAGESP